MRALDLTRYEGLTEGDWWTASDPAKEGERNLICGRIMFATLTDDLSVGDRNLLRDAPVLLAEVKRLRAEIETLDQMVRAGGR